MLLEICTFNVQSCLAAQNAGGHRIELCADPLQGGTTPSYGLIKYVLETLTIPVYPIIRPRGGNFVYSAEELEIMKLDILICKELGCRGISTGVAKPDGTIDTEIMKQLVELAGPMGVTCHKVFDLTPNIYDALEYLINAGCERVLTSGGCKTAQDGAGVIAKLIKQAAGRITIMPGGSVRSTNIHELAITTGAKEFHSSAIIDRHSNPYSDADEVSRLLNQLSTVQ